MTPREFSELTDQVKLSAIKLEAIWIDRERNQRNDMGGTKESEATKKCRLDLQKEFGLTKTP